MLRAAKRGRRLRSPREPLQKPTLLCVPALFHVCSYLLGFFVELDKFSQHFNLPIITEILGVCQRTNDCGMGLPGTVRGS